MHVGFTGTQVGMTDAQVSMVRWMLLQMSGWVHHGDCIGADAQMHGIARELDFKVAIHPPTNPSKRAFCQGDLAHQELPYLDRNKAIVNVSTELLAAPSSFSEKLRSGTWSTIRYARKIDKAYTIILPDGSSIRYSPAKVII